MGKSVIFRIHPGLALETVHPHPRGEYSDSCCRKSRSNHPVGGIRLFHQDFVSGSRSIPTRVGNIVNATCRTNLRTVRSIPTRVGNTASGSHHAGILQPVHPQPNLGGILAVHPQPRDIFRGPSPPAWGILGSFRSLDGPRRSIPTHPC